MLAGALAAGLAAGLAGCGQPKTLTASRTPPLRLEAFARDIEAIATRVRPGLLGIGLMNLESGERWELNGAHPLPMQSVFKLPLGAAAMAEVDARRLSLDEAFILDEQQLSPPWSPIAAAWPARRDYTARDLLTAAVRDSDNTAADVLMKRIGGPGAVTAWLQAKRLTGVRIDRYERELQPEAHGMASFRPAWRTATAFTAARDATPADQRRQAIRAYLADPRDTATPAGMLDFLKMLDNNELVSPSSTRLLLETMTHSRGADRLHAGLGKDTAFAHKTGSSGSDLGVNLAFNDVGIFTLADGRSYAAAAFLAGSALDSERAAGVFAQVGRAMAAAVG